MTNHSIPHMSHLSQLPERYVTYDPIPGKLYLTLHHGRSHPEEALNDWGPDGPAIGPLKWVHITYNARINLCFEDNEVTGPVAFMHDDLLQFRGMFYADWEIQRIPEPVVRSTETPPMTPLTLEILGHYHCYPGNPWAATATDILAEIRRLVEEDVLRPWEDSYTLTSKGEAWLRIILSTPYPERSWADPRRGRTT